MKQNTLLVVATLFVIFHIDLHSQNKPYLVVDEFKSTLGLACFIENISMKDDESSENKWFQRNVKLKCSLENDIIIKDSLLLRFEFMLRPEEYAISDEFYYKADSTIVKLKVSKIENLYGTQTISNSITNPSSPKPEVSKTLIIETTPFRQASIYIKLYPEDIKRILKTRNLKFRIYTNRGGSTMDLSYYEVNKLVKFIEKCGG